MDNTNDPHDMYLDTTSNQGVIVGSDIKGKYLYTAQCNITSSSIRNSKRYNTNTNQD